MTPRLTGGLSALFAVALAAGCGPSGSSGGSTAIADGDLTGVVGGKPWTLGRAETNAFLSTNSADFFVDLYATTFVPCSGNAPSDTDELILSVPMVPGDYSLGLNRIATFYINDTNKNLGATSGHILVESVTGTTVTGGAAFQFDANNKVNGPFSFTVCPTK